MIAVLTFPVPATTMPLSLDRLGKLLLSWDPATIILALVQSPLSVSTEASVLRLITGKATLELEHHL